MSAPTIAAIDCGTNSTRLLIARPENGRLETLERLMQITRLGQGVDEGQALKPEAIDRTIAVLRQYHDVMHRFGVSQVRMTATSAARDAINREDFFGAAEQVVGVRPELLNGDEEGRLSFAGATSELDRAGGPFLVVDIGGGSTEFAVGPAPTSPAPTSPAPTSPGPSGVMSVDVGCVRLTERFLHSDPPRPEELSQALSVVHDYLDDVERDLPAVHDAARFVGLAGTVTTVAAVEMGLPVYNRDRIHHFVLTRGAAEDVFRTLATEKRADRIHNPGLEEARADVIVGGCIVLVAIMRHFQFDTCLVSEADILDGLALSLV